MVELLFWLGVGWCFVNVVGGKLYGDVEFVLLYVVRVVI